MILGRKFIIWLISFAVVLAAFLLYRSASNSPVLEITSLDSNMGRLDANQFAADSNAGRIGQAKLEYLERARFETVDVKTRKLKRIVGFEKVLHKSGNEWKLDKPYMNVFQDRLRYDVTADTGVIEIENVEGSDPAPRSVVLNGNVVIHILPKMVAGPSDSFVYLNQVAFDSDRSMLTSDDDVNFVSADAILSGKGLEIIYNSVTNRLEYLKIKKVDCLNVLRDLSQTGRAKTQNSKLKTQDSSAGDDAKENKESFQCLFRDNVVLEHQNEIVLADEIAITDLVWSSSRQESNSIENPQAVQSREQTIKAVAPPDEKSTVVATVQCDGPMIIRPTPAEDSDEYKPAQFKNFHSLPDDTIQKLGKKNVLLAQRVGYDYTAQIAKAHGQVELVFYPQAGASEPGAKATGENVPFVINAKDGAEFISEQNRAVFYGDVRGRFNKQTVDYNEQNEFGGDKVIVDMAAAGGSPASAGSSDISHITVTGPGVRLESVRTLGETKLSHVRLKSARIDYDRAAEDVTATGKGTIEYRNTAAADSQDMSSKAAMDRPCFVLVEGFDKLVWDTNLLQVKAFSDKTNGVHIGYVPIEQTGYGNRITIDTRQIEIDYFEPTKGRQQLRQLYATGGIVYYEQPRYEFVGKDLFYDAQKDLMTVSGSEDMPCMLNGAMADGIEYNLKTGAASAVISSGIGIMPVRK